MIDIIRALCDSDISSCLYKRDVDSSIATLEPLLTSHRLFVLLENSNEVHILKSQIH